MSCFCVCDARAERLGHRCAWDVFAGATPAADAVASSLRRVLLAAHHAADVAMPSSGRASLLLNRIVVNLLDFWVLQPLRDRQIHHYRRTLRNVLISHVLYFMLYRQRGKGSV